LEHLVRRRQERRELGHVPRERRVRLPAGDATSRGCADALACRPDCSDEVALIALVLRVDYHRVPVDQQPPRLDTAVADLVEQDVEVEHGAGADEDRCLARHRRRRKQAVREGLVERHLVPGVRASDATEQLIVGADRERDVALTLGAVLDSGRRRPARRRLMRPRWDTI